MRTAWGLLAVVVLAGCGNKKERNHAPIVHEEEISGPMQPVQPAEPQVADEPAVAADPITPPAPARAECLDSSDVVSWDPQKLRACFDSNGDGDGDRCVTWRRDGKVVSIAAPRLGRAVTIDSEFAVEDADSKEVPDPPVEFRDGDDDERITLDSGSTEICPFDRACMKIMPKLADEELEKVLTDPDYKRAMLLMRDVNGAHATIEIWDLASGRLRTRSPMKRPVDDETYTFSAHLGGSVVIALGDNSSGRAYGTVFGLDGAVRGQLAGGSKTLDADRTFHQSGVFGIVDIGPEDVEKPYVLHLTSLATGGALGKLTIKRSSDGSDDLSLHPLKNGFVAATQFGEQVRIDMIDLRTRTNRVLLVPGC